MARLCPADLQFQSVHVAFGEVTAAGVQRQLSPRRQKVLQSKELVRLLGLEEAVLGHAHQHASGEVLVALQHIDVAWAELRHLPQMRRDRAEARGSEVRRVERTGGVTMVGALRHRQHIGRRVAKILRALRRHKDQRGGAIDPDAGPVQQVDVARSNPIRALFADGYAMRTVLFWIMFFASLLSLYLIGFWLPTVLHLEGFTPAQAVFASSLYSAGGALSVLILGPLLTRLGTDRVLTACLACGIVVIAAVALASLSYLVLLATIFIMGACVVVGQLGANGLSAAKYPARIRTTGVGWALGIGRLGGIFGPGLGGFLLALRWQPLPSPLCASS